MVSPASPPDPSRVERGAELLRGWGLIVELGSNVFGRLGHYLAGTDQERLDDLDQALRDPGVRAIFATAGGKGAYRIADGLDFRSVRADPKPLVGFSDITILHLTLWDRCEVGGFHGPNLGCWDDYYGEDAAESLRRALMEPRPLTVVQDREALTAEVLVEGEARGVLMGGNLDMLRTSVGWACPSFDGAILLVEAVDMAIGAIDRAMTQLLRSGRLEGLRGVALGQFLRSGDKREGKWSAVDVLYDRLSPLGVPVLGGLPLGHGPRPLTVPLGTSAFMDTAARTLTVQPGVC